MIVRGCSLVIILISAIVGSDAIYAKNEFPVPPGTFTTYVTDSSIHNGFKTTIVKFQSRYPVNSVLEYYRQHWPQKKDSPGHIESESMGWQIISHLSPKIQWVVQVKQGTGVYQSEGFLSRLTLEKVASEPTRKHKALFQFPSGGRSISITTSTQPAFATTYTHVFSMATSIVAKKMKAQAQRLGWQLQDETKQNRTMIQRFSQSGKTLDLAIVPVNRGKSWVFANEVKRDDQ